jgi:hypothetical protein
MLNRDTFLAGTVLFAVLWYLAYRAARPAIATAAGNYVSQHALDPQNLPPGTADAITALGGQVYANFLGQATTFALNQELP